MNTTGTLQESLAYYFHHPLELYEKIAVKISQLNYDPEFFQKVFQVFSAAITIKITGMADPSPNLSRLARVFSTVNLHDGYRLFKLPEEFFFPVRLIKIDDNRLLAKLIVELRNHFNTGNHDDNIPVFAQAGLKKQLEEMEQNGDGYETEQEFLSVLQSRFQQLQTINRPLNGQSHAYNFSTLTLTNLSVPGIKSSVFEKIEKVCWPVVHAGCIFLYFKEWNLIETAKWAQSIGNIPIFGCVNQQPLDIWVKGFAICALSCKLADGARQLLFTDQPRRKVIWQIVISSFELLSVGTLFVNTVANLKLVPVFFPVLVIVAKSLGMIEIFTRPPRTYFGKGAISG